MYVCTCICSWASEERERGWGEPGYHVMMDATPLHSTARGWGEPGYHVMMDATPLHCYCTRMGGAWLSRDDGCHSSSLLLHD